MRKWPKFYAKCNIILGSPNCEVGLRVYLGLAKCNKTDILRPYQITSFLIEESIR